MIFKSFLGARDFSNHELSFNRSHIFLGRHRFYNKFESLFIIYSQFRLEFNIKCVPNLLVMMVVS